MTDDIAPIFLSREQAAAYVGVCPDVFAEEVKAGLWPGPIRRGSTGRRLTWFRPALVEAGQRLARAVVAPPPAATPPPADPTATADAAIVERIRAKSQNRPKHRHPEAA